MSELEGEDLKVVCIRFKAGGKVRGTFIPPTTEPRNPKKYSSTIGYGALLVSGGESGGGGGVDGYGFGVTSYVTAGGGGASPQRLPGDKGKGKKEKKGKDKRGPYLRKSSLPSLGIAEGSRTFVNLLGREKEKDGAKPGKGPTKEKNKDWISAITGTKSNRDKDKSFGMQLGISGMKSKVKRLDKGKAKDTSTPPPASMSGFGYFDAGPVEEDDEILEEPNAQVEDIQENATVAEESEGEYDDEDDGDVDHDLDEDAEAGVRSDSPYSEPPPPPTIQIAPRSHPLQTEVVNLNSDSEASLALSSPVFRRSAGSDEEDLDNLPDDGKKGSAYRYGYRFGHGSAEAETGKGGKGGAEEPVIVMEKLPVRDWNGASKSKMDNVPKGKKWADDEQEPGGDDEAELHAEKEKTREKAEWIVLDMGTDLGNFDL
jgi:hypothetical protein